MSAQIHPMVDLIGILLDFLGTFFGEWINRRNGLRMIAIALVISYYSYKFYRLVGSSSKNRRTLSCPQP